VLAVAVDAARPVNLEGRDLGEALTLRLAELRSGLLQTPPDDCGEGRAVAAVMDGALLQLVLKPDDPISGVTLPREGLCPVEDGLAALLFADPSQVGRCTTLPTTLSSSV
jgi:hypothetical protein